MLHLLDPRCRQPRAGGRAARRRQAHDDPAVDRVGGVRPVRRGRADQRREARARSQPGVRRREPAHHQPRVDAGRVRDRRLISGDRRRAQLTAWPERGTDERSTVQPRGPAGALALEPAERAALRRVPARARAARRRRSRPPATAATAAQRTTPGAGVARPSTAAANGERAGGCELPAGSQAVPSSSPPPAQWETVGSMQVPQNPAVYGPERSERPVEHVLCRTTRRGAAGGDEPVGRGNGGPG